MSNSGYEIDRSQKRLGPIWLVEGIGPRNVLALFYCAMMTIVYVTSVNIIWPFLLREHLQLPQSEVGSFTSNVTVIVELVTIFVALPIGLMADRIGRRKVFFSAFMIMAAAFIIIPLVTSEMSMIAIRIFLVLGFAAGTLMLGTIIADYPQNPSRGKMISINGVLTGVGVAIFASLVFGHMPGWFVNAGYTPVDAGRMTFWIMSSVAIFTGIILWFNIKDAARPSHDESHNFIENIKVGYAEIRKNPRLGIAGLAYFVSRGDLVVLTLFFPLWVFSVGVGPEYGLSSAEAQMTQARLFGLSQAAIILFTPVIGILVDKLDRVTTLAISLGMASFGYLMLAVSPSPYESSWIYFVVLAAGAGEAFMIVSGPALVGQEAPYRIRGAIFGFVGLLGASGILVHSKISGELFDHVSYQTPFMYMAVINGLIGLAAVWVRLTIGPKKQETGKSTGPSLQGEAVMTGGGPQVNNETSQKPESAT